MRKTHGHIAVIGGVALRFMADRRGTWRSPSGAKPSTHDRALIRHLTQAGRRTAAALRGAA